MLDGINFLVLLILCLIALVLREATAKISTPKARKEIVRPKPDNSYTYWPDRTTTTGTVDLRIPRNPCMLLHSRNRNVFTRVMVRNWRKTVLGLVNLAEQNLESAKISFDTRNYLATVQAASTSVENIARALIYCCGGKPESVADQEEALRILSPRFKGTERTEYETAVDNVALISQNRIAQNFLLKHNIQDQLFDEKGTKQLLENASKTVNLFKRIVNEHFGQELKHPPFMRAQAN